MPKAEAGSSKWLSNKMKSKGLTRLRWYCQICEKPCREENAFKQHCLSESHVRRMQLVGENSKGVIEDYSRQFNNDFLRLLRTAHGDKKVNMNRFYQEYIARKDHIHMNATKWSSLTEYAKYLGREGICRVEEDEKGLYITWIDNSPEALRRQEALRKKEAQDKGDEEREQQVIREQIRRAQRDAEARGAAAHDDEKDRTLKREEGQKITLNFGPTGAATIPTTNTQSANAEGSASDPKDGATPKEPTSVNKEAPAGPAESKPLSIKMAVKPQPKNVFKQAKQAFGNKDKGASKKAEEPKKMSEVERIMREELERKRVRENSGFGNPNKKQRKF